MKSQIPIFRQPVIKHWQALFGQTSFDFDLDLNIHGIYFKFHLQSKQTLEALKNYFPKHWQQKSHEAIDVYWRSPAENLLGRYQWEDISDPNCFFENDFICQRDFLAKKNSVGSFQLMAKEIIDDGLFNFLRYALPIHLLRQQRLLFHSSCVVDQNQQAYIFFGPSGAGKTTVAQLCEPGRILGDDMNILSFKNNRLWVEGAALGQRFFDTEHFGSSFPVKQMFWLKQDTTLSHHPVIEGSSTFFLSSFANLFWDQLSSEDYQRVFLFAHKLKETDQLHQLHFPKTTEVWNYARAI